MMEQERYREQLRHRANAIKSRIPWTVRLQRPDDRKREERHRQQTSGTFQRVQEQAWIERRDQYNKPDNHEDPDSGRRP